MLFEGLIRFPSRSTMECMSQVLRVALESRHRLPRRMDAPSSAMNLQCRFILEAAPIHTVEPSPISKRPCRWTFLSTTSFPPPCLKRILVRPSKTTSFPNSTSPPGPEISNSWPLGLETRPFTVMLLLGSVMVCASVQAIGDQLSVSNARPRTRQLIQTVDSIPPLEVVESPAFLCIVLTYRVG